MSQKKVQTAQKTVTYLGFEISQGERKLGIERREASDLSDCPTQIKKRVKRISWNGQVVSPLDT